MKMKIELTVKLPIQITKTDGWFLACCDALDVMTQGETEEQARVNIAEALHLFLRSCIERGTLDAVLKECGFTAVVAPDQQEYEATCDQAGKREYLDIPLHLLSQFEENRHCRHA